MVPSESVESELRALQERLWSQSGVGDEPPSVRFANGQVVAARLAANCKVFALTTPVRGAHAALPAPVLRRLLASNAYGGPLAGGSLCLGENDALELGCVVPADFSPRQIAELLVNLAHAARTLSASIAADLASGANAQQVAAP